MRAALDGMIALFNDERGGAFAHDKSIALAIEWTAGKWWVAFPSAHRADEIERAKAEWAER